MRKLLLVLAIIASSVFGGGTLAMGETKQAPVRALHLLVNDVAVSDAIATLDKADKHGFNTIILNWRDGVAFKHYPAPLSKSAWTLQELSAVVEHARKNGMNVIPEIVLLTHQENFFANSHPELMYNKNTYDPRKPEVYKLVFAYMDEVIGLLHPTSVLIGHDELLGFSDDSAKKRLKKDEEALPADLFLQDVKTINDYLAGKSIDTWMWGDMLISPQEFGGMKAKALHGVSGGYGAALRNRMPKNIVICDWHYSDDQKEFPSLAKFKADGFRVLGATWKKKDTIQNFSQYASKHGADGMIATTWFHVRRKDWNVVDRILEISGQAFAQDFPD